jgi:ATP phosphoribosyltransferase
LRGWENDFRQLALERGFTELNLPLSLPTSELTSRSHGSTLLPAAPRFLDSNGTEWSLRTDLTVFSAQIICRHAADLSFPFSLFYSGKVFSPQGLLGAEGFRLGHASEFESYEFGAEIMGEDSLKAEKKLLNLAVAALGSFGYRGVKIVLGDARVLAQFENLVTQRMSEEPGRSRFLNQLRDAIAAKDAALIAELIESLGGGLENFWNACPAVRMLQDTAKTLRVDHPGVEFTVDPFLIRQRRFYSGLVFDFWALDADGFLKNVGGGGRYDSLMQHFGHQRSAVGFMLRDPQTTGVDDERQSGVTVTSRPIRIALPKGRLQSWGLRAFADAGIQLSENYESTRKLVIKSSCGRFEFLFVKNADVVSYVERGIAEVAIAGSDLLDEAETQSVLRPMTFAFGRCQICLAGRPEAETQLFNKTRPRIATKYPHLSLRLLRSLGLEPEIIPLQGSVELASVISYCDAIVDLVETGSTLRENGLKVFRELSQTRVQLITSRGFDVQFQTLLRHWLHQWRELRHVAEHHFDIQCDEVLKNDSDIKNSGSD